MGDYISVAIDGPSGAGKSTLSKAAAAQLHYLYVDTGAFYRTVGLAVQEQSVDPKDPSAVAALLPDIHVDIFYDADGLQHMLLNNRDVTNAIRVPDISTYASAVAAHPAVRAYLLDLQRAFARNHNVIMDGRDIGTVVLPDAKVKIFLTASPEARARRRCRELSRRGTPKDYDYVLSKIRQRDFDDSHRSEAPLRQAEDAVLLDTTALNFQESLQALLHLIQKEV